MRQQCPDEATMSEKPFQEHLKAESRVAMSMGSFAAGRLLI